jgi:hypothetical protein
MYPSSFSLLRLHNHQFSIRKQACATIKNPPSRYSRVLVPNCLISAARECRASVTRPIFFISSKLQKTEKLVETQCFTKSQIRQYCFKISRSTSTNRTQRIHLFNYTKNARSENAPKYACHRRISECIFKVEIAALESLKRLAKGISRICKYRYL